VPLPGFTPAAAPAPRAQAGGASALPPQERPINAAHPSAVLTDEKGHMKMVFQSGQPSPLVYLQWPLGTPQGLRQAALGPAPRRRVAWRVCQR